MPVWGHSTGENYVWLNAQDTRLEGRFEIRLDDLRNKLDLDLPEDYELASDAVIATAAIVQDYIQRHFRIIANGETVPITFAETTLFKADRLGHFGQYHYHTSQGNFPDQLTIRNDLLFENDRFHRSLLLVEYNRKTGEEYGAEFTAMVFSPINNEQELDFTAIHGLLSLPEFIWQGMLHIFIGIDHILFLLVMLLPVIFFRHGETQKSAEYARSVFWEILKIVTTFTVAHSITLALAALEIVQLPSRLVESMIALSIIVVAINNIFPTFRANILVIIFLFGLFHGLGFASVMGGLPFRMQDLISVILAFNVGVELGQIVIVAAIVPLLFWLRRQNLSATTVPVYGSAVMGVIAGYWFIERVLGVG